MFVIISSYSTVRVMKLGHLVHVACFIKLGASPCWSVIGSCIMVFLSLVCFICVSHKSFQLFNCSLQNRSASHACATTCGPSWNLQVSQDFDQCAAISRTRRWTSTKFSISVSIGQTSLTFMVSACIAFLGIHDLGKPAVVHFHAL